MSSPGFKDQMKYINKILANLYYSILILVPIGWVLNCRYYHSRFQSEGFDPWLCVVIALTLVLFASYLFASAQHFRQKKNNIWILFFSIYCVLALYSINCTTAGQYWDQQKVNEKTTSTTTEKSNQEYQLNEYKKSKAKAEKEYEDLEKVRGASITNLDDSWTYEEEIEDIEKRKNKLKTEIKEYEKKIDELLEQNKISVIAEENKKMSKSLYQFYSNIFLGPDIKGDVPQHEKIQFIFQVLLSIIIELIAQMAIFIFMKIKYIIDRKDKPQLIIKNKSLTKNELRHFTVIAYTGINKKQSKRLSSKNTILHIIKPICPLFTEDKYKLIIKKAVLNNLLKADKHGLTPVSDFVDHNFFYKKMCKIFKFPLTGL
jgi:flagellar motor switch/type III secretory pathway protein FliN